MEIICPNGARVQIEEDYLTEAEDENVRRKQRVWAQAIAILQRAQRDGEDAKAPKNPS